MRRAGRYHCVPSEASHNQHNGAAAETRRSWTIDEVWAEYEQSHDQLRFLVESMAPDRLDGNTLYPWNETGTVEGLVKIMMRHKRIDDYDIIFNVAG